MSNKESASRAMFHSFPASKLHLFIFIFEKTSGNINSDLLDRAFSSVTRHSFSLFVHSQHDPLNTLPSFVYDSQAATRKLRMTHSSLSPHTFLGCERVLFYFFTFFTSQGSGRYPGKIVHVQCKMFNFDCFVFCALKRNRNVSNISTPKAVWGSLRSGFRTTWYL